MNCKLRFVQNGALALMGVLILAISQTAAAQEAKPQETKGLSVDSKDVLGIAPQIPELEGYALYPGQPTPLDEAHQNRL